MAETTTHLADETLFLWVAGELDGKEVSQFEEHLRNCSECTARLQREAKLEQEIVERVERHGLAVRQQRVDVVKQPTGLFMRASGNRKEAHLQPPSIAR